MTQGAQGPVERTGPGGGLVEHREHEVAHGRPGGEGGVAGPEGVQCDGVQVGGGRRGVQQGGGQARQRREHDGPYGVALVAQPVRDQGEGLGDLAGSAAGLRVVEEHYPGGRPQLGVGPGARGQDLGTGLGDREVGEGVGQRPGRHSGGAFAGHGEPRFGVPPLGREQRACGGREVHGSGRGPCVSSS